MPTRGAAVGLLVIDGLLIVFPLIIKWQSWFAFAYIPLLVTVALGVVNSGWAKWVLITCMSVPPVLFGTVWATLALSSFSSDMPDIIFRGGKIALTCVGITCCAAALRGWIRLFRRCPDTLAKPH